MFNNFVNRHDLTRAFRLVRKARVRAVVDKLVSDPRARTVRNFEVTRPRSSQWWDVPSVQRRWSKMITGDPNRDRVEYLVSTYLPDASGLRGLSPACGTGHRERRWARTGKFTRIDAFDLTESCIEEARQQARAEGLDEVLQFEVRDINSAGTSTEPYDVLIAEQCLHHFAPIHDILGQLAQLLSRDGLFFLDDFVGPTRFQWTQRQLAAANALIELIPERLRKTQEGTVKGHIHRPSKLGMILDDPSEAVESSKILPALHEHFEVVELSPYGGTLLHLVLSEIAHNFVDGDPEAERVLDLCFRAEDALLDSGELHSDFLVAVCRPRSERAFAT